MQCPFCGHENDDGMMFCVECGANLASAPRLDSEKRSVQGDRSFSHDTKQDDDLRAKERIVEGRTTHVTKEGNGLLGAPKHATVMVCAVLIALFVVVFAVVVASKAGQGLFRDSFELASDNEGDLTEDGGNATAETKSEVIEQPPYEGSQTNPKENDMNPVGNDIAWNHSNVSDSSYLPNLVNGGHVAGDDAGWLYYTVPIDGTDWDTRAIARCRADGSSKDVIYTAPPSTINVYQLSVVGDRIVFSQVAEGDSKIMSIRSDGGDARMLDRSDGWGMCQVQNGWVFYRKDGLLRRCDSDGSNVMTLASIGGGAKWRVMNNWLYTYDSEGAREIRRSALDGSGSEVAYRATDGYFITWAYPTDAGDLIVVENEAAGSGSRVLRVDGSDGNAYAFWTGPGVERACSYSDGTLITVLEPDGSHSIFALGKKSVAKLLYKLDAGAGQIRYTSFVNGFATFGLVTDDLQCSLHAINLYGTGEHVLEQ